MKQAFDECVAVEKFRGADDDLVREVRAVAEEAQRLHLEPRNPPNVVHHHHWLAATAHSTHVSRAP